jgi:site-specific DNA-methyltransferase (adenine-specific)
MIQVYNTDAIEWLKTLDNDSVDLIVSDPPYRVTQHGHSGLGGIFKTKVGEDKKLNGKLFEHNEVDVNDYAGELYRVLKPDSHCYIMTNDRNLQNFMNVFTNIGFNFCKLLIWDKQNKITNQFYMNQVEYILFMSKGRTKQINYCGTSNLLSVNNIKNKTHNPPTEKPVELMEILIKNSTNEGDLVLDPFVGVGATPVACQNLKRNFIGCELDKVYYDTTMERLNEGVGEFFE